MAPLPEAAAVIARTVTVLRRSYSPGAGSTPPKNVPSGAVFTIFGVLGVIFVLAGIWFFFWAKNGGFHFRDGDWEDYKSTVLRRKGPNGTTLSGATESTDLGGGSVVGDRQRRRHYKDIEVETSVGTQSEMSEAKSSRGGKKSSHKSKKKRSASSRGKGKDEPVLGESTIGESVIGESVVSGDLEEDRPDEAIRAYRHEKPARVGGINRVPDSSAFEGSNVDSHSDLLSNRQRTPTSTPKKTRKDSYAGSTSTIPGIRKVESTSGTSSFWESKSGTGTQKTLSDNRDDHIKAEARKLREKGRAAAGRRDFSYTAGDDASVTASTITTSTSTTASRDDNNHRTRRAARLPPPPASDAASDLTGTKSYHHPIPELAGSYVEERRRVRARAHADGGGSGSGGGGGYRRDRRGEMSDSEEE